jgi:hypothetical protein
MLLALITFCPAVVTAGKGLAANLGAIGSLVVSVFVGMTDSLTGMATRKSCTTEFGAPSLRTLPEVGWPSSLKLFSWVIGTVEGQTVPHIVLSL